MIYLSNNKTSDSLSEPERFIVNSDNFEPAYMELYRSGELEERAVRAVDRLKDCDICPRDCGVNRFEQSNGICKTGRHAIVSNYYPHFGEEDVLRGWNGSGFINFAQCNLRCVFCDTYDVEGDPGGLQVTAECLARMMMDLQAQGCHNINLATPEHVLPQMLEALPHAIKMGLRLPIVYNSSAYGSVEALRLLSGIVDIYVPDFKFWDSELSGKYLHARDYPATAREVFQEMYRQVGDLILDEKGLAKRGLLVRHLLMPGRKEDTIEIMEFLAREISLHTYIHIIDEYHPAGKVSMDSFTELNRRIGPEEYEECLEGVAALGLYRFDQRQSIFEHYLRT